MLYSEHCKSQGRTIPSLVTHACVNQTNVTSRIKVPCILIMVSRLATFNSDQLTVLLFISIFLHFLKVNLNQLLVARNNVDVFYFGSGDRATL